MSVLVRNATIVTQNDDRAVVEGDIYIEDGAIADIGPSLGIHGADHVIDGTGQIALPGLINTHTHIPMTLLRGYGDDMPLNDWLNQKIWPAEARLDAEKIRTGTQLGIAEMIASGTTSFTDMYFFEETIAETCIDAGMRAFLGFALIDFGTPQHKGGELIGRCETFLKEWGSRNDLITPLVAPHAVYTCATETLHKCRDAAERYDTLLHLHCAETRDEVYKTQEKYGTRTVEYLRNEEILGQQTVLAHCGWLTKEEVQILGQTNTSVSHCPVSNMKLATGGAAPLPEMFAAGVTVSLGTDGAASNNTLDLFDTMKCCSLLHKHQRWDPTVLDAQTVLDLATRNGADALCRPDLGSIEIGKTADIILVDFRAPHLTPRHDVVSHLIYAARGSDVSTTIINGVPVMIDRHFTTLDYEKIRDAAERAAADLARAPDTA